MRQLLRVTATFALALVFSAGMAFGQSNDAEVEQQGKDNDATVNQTGTNDATLLQGTFFSSDPDVPNVPGISRFNTATIDQDGDFTANLGQGVGDGVATKAEASIIQSGTDGLGEIFQGVLSNGVVRRADATLNQGGSGNFGTISQGAGAISRNDEATMTLTGSNNGPSRGFQAFILQGGSEGNSGNSLSERNDATLTQTGDNLWLGAVLQGASAGPSFFRALDHFLLERQVQRRIIRLR